MQNIELALAISAEEEAIKIGIATTPEEKRAIYRLRYSIYAEEIGYNLVSVDHQNRLLYDDLDEWGTLFYAKIGAEFIGTIRVNIGQLSDFPSAIVETYSMDRFRKFYGENENYKFGLVSKGAVSSSYRSLPLFTMLMGKVFEIYCDCRVHFGFSSANFYLLPLHEYYGYRRISKNILDSDYGALASLVIIPDDIDHLQKVRSPFFKTAVTKGKTQNNRVGDWFHAQFPETANIINSRLITEDQFWAILRLRLGHPPNEVIPILQGLSEAAAKKFLYRCGVIVQCPQGDYVTTREAVSQELTVLLSGTLCSTDSPDISKITPGQHFGGIGIPNRAKHPLSVMAATNTELLVLSYHYFLKFRQTYPDSAFKILGNLNK